MRTKQQDGQGFWVTVYRGWPDAAQGPGRARPCQLPAAKSRASAGTSAVAWTASSRPHAPTSLSKHRVHQHALCTCATQRCGHVSRVCLISRAPASPPKNVPTSAQCACALDMAVGCALFHARPLPLQRACPLMRTVCVHQTAKWAWSLGQALPAERASDHVSCLAPTSAALRALFLRLVARWLLHQCMPCGAQIIQSSAAGFTTCTHDCAQRPHLPTRNSTPDTRAPRTQEYAQHCFCHCSGHSHTHG